MSKELQTALFIVKRLQFGLKTWKNSIEIAAAYAHPLKIIDYVFSIGKKGFKFLFVLLFLAGSITLIIYNKETVFTLLNDNMPLERKIEPTFDTTYPITIKSREIPDKVLPEMKIPVDSILSPSVVESTMIEPPVEFLKKPNIQKYTLDKISDTLLNFYIVANKACKVLYLLQNQKSIWKVVKEYDIAIGAQKGQKVHAGDKRTPEGQYYIVGRKEYSELASIYGPLAYILDYPNEDDRKAGRTGQGIWIHGTYPDSMPIDTKGCLEMKNNDLKELSVTLKRGVGVPVLIVYDTLLQEPSKLPSYAESEMKRSAILQQYANSKAVFDSFLIAWKIAWETKNFDAYASFYDTIQFKGQGLDWNGWRERKLRTFELYDTIAISIDHILITDYSDQSTVVKFYQQYKTNLNKNENAKKLLLEKVDDSWKITGESTCLKEELLL